MATLVLFVKTKLRFQSLALYVYIIPLSSGMVTTKDGRWRLKNGQVSSLLLMYNVFDLLPANLGPFALDCSLNSQEKSASGMSWKVSAKIKNGFGKFQVKKLET